MPGFGRRIGCEPVAKTSFAKGRTAPSDRLTVRPAVSTASTARPNTVVTPLRRHHKAGFSVRSRSSTSPASSEESSTRL